MILKGYFPVMILWRLCKNTDTVEEIYNIGNGQEYSVREVIEMCERIAERQANVIFTDRRLGDPARLVASANKIKRELGWHPAYDLESAVRTAWAWHSR